MFRKIAFFIVALFCVIQSAWGSFLQISPERIYLNAKHLFIVALFYVIQPALGSSLQISPVRIDLNAKQRIEVITLVNRGDQPVTLQNQVKRWQKSADKDVYTDTQELLVTPPIVTIAPNKTQILRVGLKNPSSTPQNYRLFLTEIPQKQLTENQPSQIRIVSRIGIPIYVNAVEK